MAITKPGHVLHTLFVRPPLSRADPPLLKKSPALLLLLVSFLLFSLGACSAGTSSTTVPPTASVPEARHLSPTPTPLPAGSTRRIGPMDSLAGPGRRDGRWCKDSL